MKPSKAINLKLVFTILTVLLLAMVMSGEIELFRATSAEKVSESENDNVYDENDENEAPSYKTGDVTGSGDVDVLDITATLQHVLGIKVLSEQQKIAADVNNDGIINVLDVALITQFVLGLIESFEEVVIDEPEKESDTDPESGQETESDLETETDPEPDKGTEPEPDPEKESEPESDPKTGLDPKPEPAPEPEPGTISLQIRIESWDHTFIPLREIKVAPYDITHIVGDNRTGNWHKDNDEPLAIHAIIKALELEGYNVQDKNVISVGSQGNYISKIDGLAEMEKGGLSGWKYRLNGKSVDLGVGQQTLKNGDLVEVYYRAGGSYHFGKIESSSKKIPAGGTVTFYVTGEPESFGAPPPFEPIEKAVITVNGNKTNNLTDDYGKVEISFDDPGTYYISAEKVEGNDYNLVRPVPVEVVVVTSAD